MRNRKVRAEKVRLKRSQETPEETKERLKKVREAGAIRLKRLKETPEENERRLKRRRELAAIRRAFNGM